MSKFQKGRPGSGLLRNKMGAQSARFALQRAAHDLFHLAFMQIDAWTKLIERLRENVAEIYGYVSDDYAGHAPATVKDLLARLGEAAPADISSPRLF